MVAACKDSVKHRRSAPVCLLLVLNTTEPAWDTSGIFRMQWHVGVSRNQQLTAATQYHRGAFSTPSARTQSSIRKMASLCLGRRNLQFAISLFGKPSGLFDFFWWE